jgi:hypothetical protein
MASRDYANNCGSAADVAWLAGRSLDELNAELADHVVDWLCPDCGGRQTTPASWTERPICCEWEMVDLIASVRRA